MRPDIFEDEHKSYRESVRRFIAEEIVPHNDEWERAGIVPRELFTKAAAVGMLAMPVPAEHGGLGITDFRFNQILLEEIGYAGISAAGLGLSLHTDIVLPYFMELCNDEQRERWLPGIASGELITAVAMTEPGTGSDLASMTTRAERDNGHYVLNGAKTFITNGLNSDLIVTAVKTDPKEQHKGISLVVVERGTPGFERGQKLEKIGQHAQDTAELFFQDARVPAENLLGEEGQGFRYLVGNLAQERLSMAVSGAAVSRGALTWTLEYVKERQAFGQPIGSFQANRFALAEMVTEIELAEVYVDQAVLALNAGTLSVEDAAKAKWWCTELQGRVTDRCLQLHGGYGFMTEYKIARAFTDARVTRIYGGTTEIMKEIVGRSLGF